MKGSEKQTSEAAIDRHVGARIRTFRLHRGWTQEKLAARLHISQQQIRKYEQGITPVAAGMLYGFSQLLGVDIAAFFEGVEGFSADIALKTDIRSGQHMDSRLRGNDDEGSGNDEQKGGNDKGENMNSEGKARTGADPYRVIADKAGNPHPSTQALKIAFALEAIPNPHLRAAITDLIAFSAGLIQD